MYVTYVPSSGEEIADNFSHETEHVDGRVRTNCYGVTTHLIRYLILPEIQKIQFTCKSNWSQCPTFILVPKVTIAPVMGQSKPEFLLTQICGVSTNINQLPNAHWASPIQLMPDMNTKQLVQTPQVEHTGMSSV